MQHILFIMSDFERYLRLKEAFSEFFCDYSISVPDGIRRFNQEHFSLIVLDLSLLVSDAGQAELLCAFRRAQPVPIIALCGNMEDANIVRLLGAGADQILAIQGPDEVLAAYMRTLISRYTLLNHFNREQLNRADFCIGDFTIDLMRRQVFLKGEKVELSAQEYDLLLFFAQNSDRVLTEEQIYNRVWNTDKDFHSGISKPINRLRQKIEPDIRNPTYIHSIRGVGYQFTPKSVESCDI